GAEADELLALHQLLHDLADLLVEQRLAARDGDHRRPALLHGVDAFLHREPLVEDVVGVIDLAAAGAGEIAAEQRLEHEHQREPLVALDALLDEIGADTDLLDERNAHGWTLPRMRLRDQAAAERSWSGSLNWMCSSMPCMMVRSILR